MWIASSQELRTIQNEVGQAVSHLFGQYCLDFNKKYFVIERQLLSLSYLRQVEELSAIKDFKQIPFKELTLDTRMLSYSFGQELTEHERDLTVNNKSGLVSILCETNFPSTTRPGKPTYKHGVLTCPRGTKEVKAW